MTLGIGIMSFDRPDYLRGTLHGLMTNDLTDCDVWLFQALANAIRARARHGHDRQSDRDA